eukprot:2397179-Rhodomonas_salina.2
MSSTGAGPGSVLSAHVRCAVLLPSVLLHDHYALCGLLEVSCYGFAMPWLVLTYGVRLLPGGDAGTIAAVCGPRHVSYAARHWLHGYGTDVGYLVPGHRARPALHSDFSHGEVRYQPRLVLAIGLDLCYQMSDTDMAYGGTS